MFIALHSVAFVASNMMKLHLLKSFAGAECKEKLPTRHKSNMAAGEKVTRMREPLFVDTAFRLIFYFTWSTFFFFDIEMYVGSYACYYLPSPPIIVSFCRGGMVGAILDTTN